MILSQFFFKESQGVGMIELRDRWRRAVRTFFF